MSFKWSLSQSKSFQVSRTLFRILTDLKTPETCNISIYLITRLISFFLRPMWRHKQFSCVLSIFVLIIALHAVLLCGYWNDSVSFFIFPFLHHVFVNSGEISSIYFFKYSFYYFFSWLQCLIVIMLTLQLLAAAMAFLLFFCVFCVYLDLLHRWNTQCWWVIFLLFLTLIVSQCDLSCVMSCA